MEMPKEKKIKPKVKREPVKIPKSFGEVIREYQKLGYGTRESIERAYYNTGKDPREKKAKKKIDMIGKI